MPLLVDKPDLAPPPRKTAEGPEDNSPKQTPSQGPTRSAQQDPWWCRALLISLALATLTLLVVIPVIHVFAVAFSEGPAAYIRHLFFDRDTLHAIGLTATVAPLAVAINVVFGLATAWLIARYAFPGRTLLISLLDLPLAVSPVVVGLLFLLLFGRQGLWGAWLADHGIRIAFAWPGLVIVTTFVTLPYVAREVLPVLESLGPEEDLAAVSLGANFRQMFWLVTLPNVRWGLLYGIILCNTRAMGEFGAVYVISGHIAGKTDTMPLRIEKLFQEYNTPGAFAVASLLTLLAVATLVLRQVVATRQHS